MCKAFGLTTTGTKAIVKARLLTAFHPNTYNHKIMDEFSHDEVKNQFPKRPDGELFEFGEHNSDIVGHLLGLERKNPIQTLQLVQTLAAKSNGITVPCYLNSSALEINKAICRWCLHTNECDSKESDFQREDLRFGLHVPENWDLKNEKRLRSDVDRIKNFIIGKEYQINYNIDRPDAPFSNSIDPFRPYFGRKHSRKLFIVPLICVTAPDERIHDSHWSHTFYSKFMNRTLTMFEGMIIRLCTSTDFGLSADDEFPTLRSVKNYTDEFSVTQANWRCLAIENHDMTPRIYETILNAEKHFYNGLYEIRVDLFRRYKENVSFEKSLRNFIQEIRDAVDNHFHKDIDQQIFFEQRMDIIILDNSRRRQMTKFLPKYRPIRMITIPELSNAWAIADGEVSFPKDSQHIPIKGSENAKTIQTMDAFLETLQSSNMHPMGFSFHKWNMDLNGNTAADISLFDYDELIEAYACHLQYINQKLTQNDENFFTRREDFELVIERIFFPSDGRKIPNHLQESYDGFLKDFFYPRSRVQQPLERMLALSKSYPKMLRYTEDPDRNDVAQNQVTEEFTFFQSYILNDNEIKRRLSIRRVSREDTINRMGIWNSYRDQTKQRGYEPFLGQHILLPKLLSCLNSDADTGKIKLRNNGLYCSNSFQDVVLLEANANTNSKLIKMLGKILNQNNGQGVTCIATESEYEKITDVFGKSANRKHIVELCTGETHVFVSWLPSMSGSVTSNLAMYVGLGS